MTMAMHAYGKGTELGSLYQELSSLESHYKDLLAQESLRPPVGKLKQAMEDAMKGRGEAVSYLREEGESLFCAIEDKLEAALAEQERIIDESPSVAEETGGAAVHRISRAVSLLLDAKKRLPAALTEL